MRQLVVRFHQASPFQPFAIALENGEHLIVDHPENIAYRRSSNGQKASNWFAVIGPDGLSSHATFDSITRIAAVDRGEALESSSAQSRTPGD